MAPSLPSFTVFLKCPLLSEPCLDHLIYNKNLESEVIPQGHRVNGRVCLAPCTFHPTLTSFVDILMTQVVKARIFHLRNKKNKYQKGEMTYPGSHSNNLIELGCTDLLSPFCKTLFLYNFLSECMLFSFITIL